MTTPEVTEAQPETPLRVGIALIRKGDSFLVRQRPEGAPMAGYWEFPGGKCESGETPEEATRRECLEETGREVTLLGLRDAVEHRYPHGWVAMSFFDAVFKDADDPAPATGFVWKPVSELPSLRFPGANETILRGLLQEAFPSDSEQK